MEPNHNPPIPPIQFQTQAPATSSGADLKLPTLPEMSLPAPHHTSWGAFIGIIIIVSILIVGALYFWGAKLEKADNVNLSPDQTPPQ
jgi:hypothetical protein